MYVRGICSAWGEREKEVPKDEVQGPKNTKRVIRSCAWYLDRIVSKIKTSAHDNMVV